MLLRQILIQGISREASATNRGWKDLFFAHIKYSPNRTCANEVVHSDMNFVHESGHHSFVDIRVWHADESKIIFEDEVGRAWKFEKQPDGTWLGQGQRDQEVHVRATVNIFEGEDFSRRVE